MKSDNFFTSFFPRPLSFRSTALLTAFIFLFTSSLVISPEELFAAPVVEAPQTAPTSIEPNAPVNLLVTVPVVRDQADPIVVPGGAYLMQVDPQSGAMITNFGAMRDDGLEGDAVAGDDVWSLRIAIEEAPADGLGLKASIAFERVIRRVESPITVVPVLEQNLPPVFTTEPLEEAVEGHVYYYQAAAEDPEQGEVTLELMNGPKHLNMSPNGFLQWTPQHLQVGAQPVEIKATDPQGKSTMQVFSIDVAPYNYPPVFTSQPQRQVNAGEQYNYDAEVFDRENTQIVFSLDEAPAGMTINAGTGEITWTPQAGEIQNVEIVVRATDAGEAFALQPFMLHVITEPLNLIMPTGEYEVIVGETLELTLEANYPNAGFRVTPLPENATLPYLSNTFSFTPTEDQVGIYNLGFEAVFAKMRDVNPVLITVVNSNHPPVLDAFVMQSVSEGEELRVSIKASDEDGDPLSFFLPDLNVENLYIDEVNEEIVFLPAFDQAGNYQVLVRVSDGKASAEQVLDINVLNVEETNFQSLDLVVDNLQNPNFRTTVPVSGSVTGEVRSQVHTPPVFINSLSPAAVFQGREITVDIGGFNTNFDPGSSTVDFGEGITVKSFDVLSATTAQAVIGADISAQPGPRQVIVRQGTEEVLSAVVFSVGDSASRIDGTLIDAFTKQPIVGARVGVNGSRVIDITDGQGLFRLDGLPVGQYNIVITAPNYQVVTLDIALDKNMPLDLGEIEINALARPFEPGGNIERGATLASVLDRGISAQETDMTLEQAKALIMDALIALPGNEYGVYDESGSQLNPTTQGPGAMSLTPEGVSRQAQALLQGELFKLGDMLDAIHGSFMWIFDDRFSKQNMLEALRGAVERAWESPGDPHNALTIMVFNDGNTLSTTPPEINLSTPLNHFQAFLLITSFMTHFAPTLDYAFRQLYETNGLEAPEIKMDYDTLERVVTLHGEEIRSGAPGVGQGDFGQPAQLAGAAISEFFGGSTVFAEEAGPNDANNRPNSPSGRTWGQMIAGELFNYGTALALSFLFVVLGVIVLGWVGLGAGLAGATLSGLFMAAFISASIGYLGTVFARAAGAYFGPEAVRGLSPPPPGAIRHRQSDDVRKVYIQFQKDYRHEQRDLEGGTGEPLFPRLATLVDLFGPEVNLDLIEFEYQLWKVKDIRTHISDKKNVQLISSNAVPVPPENVEGFPGATDFMQFVLPIERLDEGENIFKIRTVMFYRGHLLFEQDVIRNSGITLRELGIPPSQNFNFDLGYKDAISLTSTELSVSTAETDAFLDQIEARAKAAKEEIERLNTESGGIRDNNLEALKARQKVWQNALEQESARLKALKENSLSSVERAKALSFGETKTLVNRYMENGGNVQTLLDPNSDINRNLVTTAGGQAEFDNIRAEIEQLAEVHDEFARKKQALAARSERINKLKAERLKFDAAYQDAHTNNRSKLITVEYELQAAPNSANPNPIPEKVKIRYAIQPDGVVINLETNESRTMVAEAATFDSTVRRQEGNYNTAKRDAVLDTSEAAKAEKRLQNKFVAQERIDQMNLELEKSNDRIKRLTEARDRHKAEIDSRKQNLAKKIQDNVDAAEVQENNVKQLKDMKVKVEKSNIRKLADSNVVRALNSNTAQGILTAATVVTDSAWEIREGIKMLASPFSAAYVVNRSGNQVTQFTVDSPPVPPFVGPPVPGPGPNGGGPLPRTRMTLRETLSSLNVFSLPPAFAQSPPAVFAPFFESDPSSENLMGFLRTLSDPNNPKGGFIARQHPFTAPDSYIASAGFPSDFIAVDSKGGIYLLNGNSYESYGGRIFRYSGDPTFREHIGVMNYRSQLLGFTRKVRPIAMEIGEFKDATYDHVENLFIANREEGIPLLSGAAPPPNRILRVPVHLADLHPAYANGQNRGRIVGQAYVSHPDFKFTGPSDMERDSRPRMNDSDPPRPIYFSDEENIFAIKQIEGEEKGEAVKIVNVPGRRWSGLAQDVLGNLFFADYNRGEVYLLAAEDLDNIVNGSNGEITSDSELDFRAFLIKVGIDRPGDIELDTLQERYVVSTPNGFEPFDIVLIGRYSTQIRSIVSDVLGQHAPVTLRPGRGNVFIVGKPTEGDDTRRVRLKIKRRNSETGQTYWSEEAMHLEEFGMTIHEGTLT